jgi:hypothetical protein
MTFGKAHESTTMKNTLKYIETHIVQNETLDPASFCFNFKATG